MLTAWPLNRLAGWAAKFCCFPFSVPHLTLKLHHLQVLAAQMLESRSLQVMESYPCSVQKRASSAQETKVMGWTRNQQLGPASGILLTRLLVTMTR